jgi:hypothetical protein
MIPEWELWACAHHFIRRHGDDAAIIAGLRADELLAASDFEGLRTYQAIITRINRLLESPSGALH